MAVRSAPLLYHKSNSETTTHRHGSQIHRAGFVSRFAKQFFSRPLINFFSSLFHKNHTPFILKNGLQGTMEAKKSIRNKTTI